MREMKGGNLCLCLFYMIYVFMYAIVVKTTILNSVIFTLKTYVLVLILVIVCILALFCNEKKVQIDSALLLFGSLVIYLFNYNIHWPGETMFYLICDIYISRAVFCLLKMRLSVKSANFDLYDGRLVWA